MRRKDILYKLHRKGVRCSTKERTIFYPSGGNPLAVVQIRRLCEKYDFKIQFEIVRRMENDKEKTCCVCGKKFTESGNSPLPVKEEGECCRVCNWMVVLRERSRKSKQSKK